MFRFGLISDFFTPTPLKTIFEISSVERMSHDFIEDSHVQKNSKNVGLSRLCQLCSVPT